MAAAVEHRMRMFLATGPRVILGSASTSRRLIMDELCSKYGFTYEVRTADINEKAIRHDDPHQLVLALGRAKRDAIRAKMQADSSWPTRAAPAAAVSGGGGSGTFLITCDQVVLHRGVVLEKPETSDECRMFIKGYAQAPASTVGSVICTDMSSGKSCEAVDVSHIHMAPIPDDVVDKLVEEGDCMWCAGGLMVEHPLVVPYVTKIEGTEDGVRGLDKALVVRLLLEAFSGSGYSTLVASKLEP